MRILWKHIQAITLALCGDNERNRTKLHQYQEHWEISENEIKKKGR